MAEPRGLVLIAGPDGAGKSTVVDALVARATARGTPVWRAHHRPGVVAGGRQDGKPVTDPHAAPARSVPAALLKLLVVFADHLVGGYSRWRGQRRSGLLLLERGWFDMAVDPRRYRLPDRMTCLVRLLGFVLPRADLVLLVSGDAAVLHARKPEIGVTEVERQIRRWRTVAPATARRVAEVDTVRTSAVDAAAGALAALSAPTEWRTVPLTPARLALRTIGAARPALGLYQPLSLQARAGAILRRTLGVPGRRVGAPLPDLGELWGILGIAPSGVVVMHSSTPGRLIFSVCRGDRMDFIVKVGRADDVALRHEADMLATALRPVLPVRRPEVVWFGEWRDRYVLVTRAAQRCSTAPWTVEDVVPLIQTLGRASADGAPLTHGDLAPWNMVRTSTGTVLLDWESARWADEPLHDLAHFVVQNGALLGRYRPDRAVAILCDEGSPGWRLLRARGRSGSEARSLLGTYLTQARPTEPRAMRYQAEMHQRVTALEHMRGAKLC